MSFALLSVVSTVTVVSYNVCCLLSHCDCCRDTWLGLAPIASPETLSDASSICSSSTLTRDFTATQRLGMLSESEEPEEKLYRHYLLLMENTSPRERLLTQLPPLRIQPHILFVQLWEYSLDAISHYLSYSVP